MTSDLQLLLGLAVLLFGAAWSSSAAAAPDDDAAYTKTITERAEKVVAPLELADAAQAGRVRDLLVEQYRGLRKITDERDAKLKDVKSQPGDKAVAEAFIGVVRNQAALQLDELHRRFVARLAAELTPEQVDKIKDGMTYGVVDVTYRVYLEMIPTLTDEQKTTIKAYLLEGREYAMDGGSSDEKHAIFGKYKGRINNYLSSIGINMKQAEKDLAERQKAAK